MEGLLSSDALSIKWLGKEVCVSNFKFESCAFSYKKVVQRGMWSQIQTDIV